MPAGNRAVHRPGASLGIGGLTGEEQRAAQRAREIVAETGSLAAYFWRFEPASGSRPAKLTREILAGMSTSPEALALSKDLKRRGFTFVGPTTVYAFMQAMGLVNDHVHGCVVRAAAERARAAFARPVPAS